MGITKRDREFLATLPRLGGDDNYTAYDLGGSDEVFVYDNGYWEYAQLDEAADGTQSLDIATGDDIRSLRRFIRGRTAAAGRRGG